MTIRSLLADEQNSAYNHALPRSAFYGGPGFFSTLNEVGYSGPLCIEVEDRAYEATLERRKAALRQSARFLRQFTGP